MYKAFQKINRKKALYRNCMQQRAFLQLINLQRFSVRDSGTEPMMITKILLKQPHSALLQISATRKPMQVVGSLWTWDEFLLKYGVQIKYRRYVLGI